jgi:heme/copper-type cytochrome/quinol oxidase subunit 2
MKKTSRYNTKVGKLLFVIPAVVIIVLGVYAFIHLNSPGVLIVRAEDENFAPLAAPFTVNGNSYTTPENVSLSQGSYVVTFGTIPWYYPPVTRDVTIAPGYQAYAVGSYQPETKSVQVTPSGFNETAVVALHGVTPVTWINPSSSLVTFSGGPFQQVRLQSGQSYTYTFTTPESFVLNVGTTNENMTVTIQ